jgi:hypothetical protein
MLFGFCVGGGAQVKSYLYVDDWVGAVLTAFDCMRGRVEVLNVGLRIRLVCVK